ncbi:hypothetical protein ACF3DV_19625 [Chlorogloeopsis fritschii PCC 9212]|nr:hypothetical protein [Chlorogloeopsis fritschii]
MKIIFRNAKTPAQTRYIASLHIKFIPRFSNADLKERSPKERRQGNSL